MSNSTRLSVAATAPGARHFAGERFFATAPVRQAGDLIGERQARQRGKPLLAVGSLQARVEFEGEPPPGLHQRIDRAGVEAERLEIEDAQRAVDPLR